MATKIGTFLGDLTLVVLLTCGTGPLALRLGYEIVRMRHPDAPAAAGTVLMLEALFVALGLYVLLTAAGMVSLKWAIHRMLVSKRTFEHTERLAATATPTHMSFPALTALAHPTSHSHRGIDAKRPTG